MSANDRFSYGPGELWIIDEESGTRERLGDVPPRVERDRKIEDEDAVGGLRDREAPPVK